MGIKEKYIFGASGHGKVVAECIKSNNEVVIGFFDDAPNYSKWNNIPVHFSNSIPIANTSNGILIAIGNNSIRKKISNRLTDFNFFEIKHQSAIIGSNVSIEIGTVVMANTVINSDTYIGKHCIINTSAVIEHDCKIGDFVHVGPKAVLGGNVSVEEGVLIGIGAILIPGITIGKWVTIGAGTVVLSDVPDYAVVVGNPGKIIKYNKLNE
jgi:acetyltransferase EpsM